MKFCHRHYDCRNCSPSLFLSLIQWLLANNINVAAYNLWTWHDKWHELKIIFDNGMKRKKEQRNAPHGKCQQSAKICLNILLIFYFSSGDIPLHRVIGHLPPVFMFLVPKIPVNYCFFRLFCAVCALTPFHSKHTRPLCTPIPTWYAGTS